MKKTFVLHINGFPGTGKLTIAKEIAKWENTHLIDNHMLNNPVFALVRTDGKSKIPSEAWDSIRSIRKIVLDGMVSFSKPSLNFVFTNALCQEDKEEIKIFQQIQNAAIKRGSVHIPVILKCDLKENQRRIVNLDREKNMKMRDEEGLAEIHETCTLVGTDQKNALLLDVTCLSASEAAKKILTHKEQVLNFSNI